jgi:hypothetical protein
MFYFPWFLHNTQYRCNAPSVEKSFPGFVVARRFEQRLASGQLWFGSVNIAHPNISRIAARSLPLSIPVVLPVLYRGKRLVPTHQRRSKKLRCAFDGKSPYRAPSVQVAYQCRQVRRSVGISRKLGRGGGVLLS